ncbi:Metallo-hydrolase/oxidoreductase [Basidiobolus meristosporus CBS 931.73]|uniref:Metallo-hydrolase/oxidoreductase n=1 Tax=Basidiobolus meristosporus CBS 931.73 TaxID=1314790 RepID=A0A1Y1YEA3_9FUNG|nr:Metallo-hydrolase/oxidoreductase [Basidiobolus meristosporus CBS 931.73]|eukprot:ORX96381.1 Metallo-hydrolase/oxidoreductase [Basidiobolus meristosporus CBS 931.73]
MRSLKFFLHAFGLLVLPIATVGLPTQPKLQVIYHSPSPALLSTVSTAIIGEQEVVVIDSGFTSSAALQMISLIRQTTDLPVTRIFATHEHPDHYFGATEFLKAYPKAALLASPSVAQRMEAHAQQKVNQWTPVFGPAEIPRSPIIAQPFDGNEFFLTGNEDEPIQILQPLQGDVEDVSVYWIPSQKILITGDIVYSSKAHVWLAEATPAKNRENWIRTLNYLQSLDPALVLAGHVPDTEEPKVSDISATKEYIEYFNDNIFAKGYTPSEILDLLKSKYPDRTGMVALNQTAFAYGAN